MKGVSPLIGAVLLIAFVFSVGIIFMGWLTGVEKKHANYVAEKGEKQVKCVLASFKIIKDLTKYNFSSSVPINLTIINTGNQPLYNFTFTITTDKGILPKVYIFEPINQKTIDKPLGIGESWIVSLIPIDNSPSPGETLSEIYATALCQKTFTISYTLEFD